MDHLYRSGGGLSEKVANLEWAVSSPRRPKQVKKKNYDRNEVDEMVLAFLYLTSSRDKYAARVWKGLD